MKSITLLNVFKIGGKVRVIKSCDSYENNWFNAWVPEMDAYVGKELIVTHRRKSFTFFCHDSSNGCFEYLLNDVAYFPHFVLEEVK